VLHATDLHTLAGILAVIAGWIVFGRASILFYRRRDPGYLWDRPAMLLNAIAVSGWWTATVIALAVPGLDAVIPALVGTLHTAAVLMQIRAYNGGGYL
jgi:hypothetical protein